MLCAEVQHRYDQLALENPGLKKPRPSGYTIAQCTKWLSDNPVKCPVDVAWLMNQEAKMYTLISAAARSKEAESEGDKSSSWTCNEPQLRLRCCTFDDITRAAFSVKDNSLTRAQLDARNTDDCPKGYKDTVAELFNDSNNVHCAGALPNLHGDFSEEIELPFNPKWGTLTSDGVKDRLGNTGAVLIKIIPNWEQSRKDFGARKRNDGECGHIADEIIHEHGDRRANFLQGFKSHVLYFRHLCDNQGMLQKVLSCKPLIIHIMSL